MAETPSPFQCEAVTIKIVDVKTLIILLASPDHAVKVAALDGIAKYSEQSDKNKSSLIQMGVVKYLKDLYREKHLGLKKSAAACLSSISEHDVLPPDLKQKELLEVLIESLSQEENFELLDETALALAQILQDYSMKVEFRKLGGMQVLVKLLDMPDPDVKKNSAMAICAAIDEFANRTELRFAKGFKPLIDLLASDYLEVQEWALKCLYKCVEDLECLVTFIEEGGMKTLIALMNNEDSKIRSKLASTIAASLKSEKNQMLARELGLLSIVVTQLNSMDPITSSSAAIIIAAMAKNESNMNEFVKQGVFEVLLRHVTSEERVPRRESLAALTTFLTSAKNKLKFRTTNDNYVHIIKLLANDDLETSINASDCLATLSEDLQGRSDILKNNAMANLISMLESSSIKAQTSACITLCHLIQEGEGLAIMNKYSKQAVVKLVDLISSVDLNVSKVATYALSLAVQSETNAINACSAGALDSLIELSKKNNPKSSKFATIGLEKLLNYHLSAKYWLVGHLSGDNTISDRFYDMGSSGVHFEKVGPFPTLAQLQSQKIDKNREIILVELQNDLVFNNLYTFLADCIPNATPELQVKMIAITVAKQMGGAIESDQLSGFNYKFKIAELKVNNGSNVLPIGSITQGIFYHRALLFKVLCDRLNLKPCTLNRGEYNRAWNTLDIKNLVMSGGSKPIRKERSAKPKSLATPSSGEKPISPELKLQYFGMLDIEHDIYQSDEPAIVDLMFNPGTLIPVSSPEAAKYTRISAE